MKLLPCPFCGGVSYEERESKHWTGMRSQVLSVTITHRCLPVSPPPAGLAISCKGKTLEDAVANWNERATELAAMGIKEAARDE